MRRPRALAWSAAIAAVAIAAAVIAQITSTGHNSDTEDVLMPGTAAIAASPPAVADTVPLPSPSLLVPPPELAPTVVPSQRVDATRRTTGTVVDGAGHPLAGIRILSPDVETVLGRTDRRGRFSVRCPGGLVFAAYAFAPGNAPRHRQEEMSPGVGNHAFRVLGPAACGRRIRVRMPTGGVIYGEADAPPGSQIRVSLVTKGNYADGTGRYGSFLTTVDKDGLYRIEGLATGRYSIDSSYEGFPDEATFVDVREGQTSDGTYTYYQDPAVCYENPDAPDCTTPAD